MTAVVLKQPGSEFWAVVGPDKRPAEPTARSREEFEMKLALLGLELTGRELAWPETGMSSGLMRNYDARAFEVGRTVKEKAGTNPASRRQTSHVRHPS